MLTMPSGSVLRLATTAVALALSSACAAPMNGSPSPAPTAAEGTASLWLTNRSPLDVVVYLQDGREERRLGRVAAGRSALLTIHELSASVVPVQLLVRPNGVARSFASAPILIRRGQTLDLTIQDGTGIPAFSVW